MYVASVHGETNPPRVGFDDEYVGRRRRKTNTFFSRVVMVPYCATATSYETGAHARLEYSIPLRARLD
jgi:hypothetical protein